LSLIVKGKIKKFTLGNIDSMRDWGHAKDYVFAMWKMLQLKVPEDFVIGTGKVHSVKQFLKIAFSRVNLDYKKFIKIDKKDFRKKDKILLKANFKKAQKILRWQPKISFKTMINEMVDYDLSK